METTELKQQLAEARLQDLRLILMATIAVCLFWVVFARDSGPVLESTKPSIGTVYPEGPIRYRQGRSLEWNDFSGEFPVFERDSIFTPAGSTAYIELNEGGVIDLKPNSLVKLVGLGAKADVGIVFGQSSRSAFDADALRNMIYACTPPPTVKQLEILEVPELPVLPVSSVKLLPTRKVANVKALPLDDLSFYNLKLITPADGAGLPRTSLWVSFTWTEIPVKGVSYTLEVSRLKDFSAAKIGSKNAQSGGLLLLNLPGTYYARVTARLGKQAILSKVNQFEMLKVARKPATKAP